ncbi:MAG: hypothetical protein F6K36_16715 [Symploca sp. SIO3C6]|uniref:Uncharacterized protein n=1 Tax=Symploca sp. SIO1C4 TaxID=2607765 RepID=A0A6B3NPN6_9CYAN|nr:hypothetical protein [Symploca sp. SIO3C6]NER31198.1 hypothetical protein [Symploca sp. SIO1C4]
MTLKRLKSLADSHAVDSRKRTRILTWLIVVCEIGLALVILGKYYQHLNSRKLSAHSEEFRLAVNKAMNAADLTQSAQSSQEWNQVATNWQEAIDLMKAVPTSSSKYPLAQAKVNEYQRNLEYSQGNVEKKSSSTSEFSNYWTLGSRWEEVTRIQGMPSQLIPSQSLCQEVAYYDNSKVEIKNGIVIDYENGDNNLRIAANESVKTGLSGNNSYWTIGSKRKDVVSIQGTPTEIFRYDSLDKEILNYRNSTVELQKGIVTAYSNSDKNLRVNTQNNALAKLQGNDNYWTVGSKREDVFNTQGTPTEIVHYDYQCKEVLRYGSSSIELKNGVVNGYQNLDENLKVN